MHFHFYSGYVVSVRERDVKTCWPLFMPNNESSNTPSNKLPLLHVSKFKRWNCVNCLHTNSTSEDRTGNADLGLLDNKKTKRESSLSFLNSNAKRSFSCPKKFSENIIPGERLVSDSANDINHAEFNPDPCHGKQADRFTREDVARTGRSYSATSILIIIINFCTYFHLYVRYPKMHR